MSARSGVAQKVWLEVIWWIITAAVTFLVILPIHKTTNDYPFLWINILFVVVFITVTRYIFLLKHTFIARRQTLKIIFFFLCIPLIFNMVNNLNYFITVTDESSFFYFKDRLPRRRQWEIQLYIRSEMLLFGVGSIIASVLFPFRLLISVWRTRNKGTV